MILVDSSVWIDYFRGDLTPQSDRLDQLLSSELLLIGDLILAEVLQGFVSEHDFNQAKTLLTALPVVPLVGLDVALQAARNFHHLRMLGVTVRKTIDVLIGTFCVAQGFQLVHNDVDFDRMAKHIGLEII